MPALKPLSPAAQCENCRRRTGGRTAAALLSGVALAVAALALAPAAYAADLTGSWRGGGSMTLASGASERVTCRARYHRLAAGTYALKAVCATQAGALSQAATVREVGSGRFSGEVFNAEYNARGNISIAVSGDRQTVTVQGDTASGRFLLSRQ